MGQVNTPEKFWARIDHTNPGCWPWPGGRHVTMREEVKLSFPLYGPIPDGLCVLHRCDNPPCVRPDHLFLGTKSTNAHDRTRKGREARGERAGNHKLTDHIVREIRAIHADGETSQTELAKLVGVSQMTISLVVRRRSWRHVL